MKEEKSCGAVIYKKENGEIKYLLIHQKNGLWSFPKGHMENEETELETAKREIREEVALDVNLNSDFRCQTDYVIHEKQVLKHVVFFLATINSGTISLQEEELDGYVWLNYDNSLDLVTFDNSKETLIKANEYLLTNTL